MKMEMTPEEHARLHRRRGRQALGLLIAVLVLIGTLTVLHAGVSAVASCSTTPPSGRNTKISWRALCCSTRCPSTASRTSTT